VILMTATPGRLETPEGWSWTWSSSMRPAVGFFSLPPHVAVMDQERFTFPLVVRCFRAGDRFWPLGAPGSKKLQDFLVDARMPRWLRPHIPMVVSRGQIVWVAGLRPAEPVRVTESSRTLLTLELRPTSPETLRIWEMLLASRQRQP
jgi:tRNA(Ile)-lysidine synthase